MLPKAVEHKCPVCNGTGYPALNQPKEPGRRIHAARCERCDGKGPGRRQRLRAALLLIFLDPLALQLIDQLADSFCGDGVARTPQ